MGSREFSEWLVFMRHEPIGGARADVQAGIVAAAAFNAAGPRRPSRPSDFVVEWWRQRDATVSAGEALLRRLHGMAGKAD